jgi:hypothetical protein
MAPLQKFLRTKIRSQDPILLSAVFEMDLGRSFSSAREILSSGTERSRVPALVDDAKASPPTQGIEDHDDDYDDGDHRRRCLGEHDDEQARRAPSDS